MQKTACVFIGSVACVVFFLFCRAVECSCGGKPMPFSIEGEWTSIYVEGFGFYSTLETETALAQNRARRAQRVAYAPEHWKITKDAMGTLGGKFPVGGDYYKLDFEAFPAALDRWLIPKVGEKNDVRRGLCILKDGFLITCEARTSEDRPNGFTTREGAHWSVMILRKGTINVK